MKRILLILILTLSFQSWTKASDIRDLEIDGMSVGDSLLDHYNEEKIKKNEQNYFKNNKYKIVEFENISKIYETQAVTFLSKDKDYKIAGLSGLNKFKNNINECFKQKDEIVKNINELFKKEVKLKLVKRDDKEGKHSKFPDGKSKYYVTLYEFENKDLVAVACLDFHIKDTKTSVDHLRVDIYTDAYHYFLNNEAYK